MSEYTKLVGVALFVVWMQRQKRWNLFFGALSGRYAIPSPVGSTA